MESPTPDYLHDFLEGTLLMEELKEMRQRVLEEAAALCVDEATETEILGSLDAKLIRVGAWVQLSEESAERLLQGEADRADAGRELFFRVSEAIAELMAMPPKNLPRSLRRTGVCGRSCGGTISACERCGWTKSLPRKA